MERRALGRLPGLIRGIFAAEQLDELPKPPVNRTRKSLFGLLTERETLPTDPALADEKPGFLPWLLQSEALPLDPAVPTSGRKSFLETLFSGERLAEDPEVKPGARRVRGGGA